LRRSWNLNLGASRLSYPPVVANGISNNTIHYIANDDLLRDGNLVLMDAGGEFFAYCGDITRTFPVSGRFTDAQRELYLLLLDVQLKCIQQCSRRDMTLDLLNRVYVNELAVRLQRIGLLSNAQNIHQLAPHSIGHYLGMDVHDCSSIETDRPFRPGLVVTVEPGLYLPDEDWIPKKYRGIGIRIEDDVLITEEDGAQVLTASAPKHPDEIEQVMRV